MGINGRSDVITALQNLGLVSFRPRWGLTAVLTSFEPSLWCADTLFPSPMGINGRSDMESLVLGTEHMIMFPSPMGINGRSDAPAIRWD